ncbi:MAG: chalcone isomerase family protein [Wenzhouxiangella sp.]|nr:chalcone isomerase family protein [Wenzhouxiangella sp.]TVR96915.1 MAG: hypothetical protein EA418_04495 [Wenzhouxiangellaceae bacterium]
MNLQRAAGLVWGGWMLACPALAESTPGPLDMPVCSELELRVGGLFRVGTARLYLDDCGRARDDVLAPVPKQFSLELARRFSGQDLSDAAYDLLRRNLGLETDDPLPEPLACLARAYVDADVGDRYDVSFSPERGLALHLNGELLQSCDEQGPAEKYFLIWFGDQPFHRRMRDALLERAESTARSPYS